MDNLSLTTSEKLGSYVRNFTIYLNSTTLVTLNSPHTVKLEQVENWRYYLALSSVSTFCHSNTTVSHDIRSPFDL